MTSRRPCKSSVKLLESERLQKARKNNAMESKRHELVLEQLEREKGLLHRKMSLEAHQVRLELLALQQKAAPNTDCNIIVEMEEERTPQVSFDNTGQNKEATTRHITLPPVTIPSKGNKDNLPRKSSAPIIRINSEDMKSEISSVRLESARKKSNLSFSPKETYPNKIDNPYSSRVSNACLSIDKITSSSSNTPSLSTTCLKKSNSVPSGFRNESPSRMRKSAPSELNCSSSARNSNTSPSRLSNSPPSVMRNTSPSRLMKSPSRMGNTSPPRLMNSSSSRMSNTSPSRLMNSSSSRTKDTSPSRPTSSSPSRKNNTSPSRLTNSSPSRMSNFSPSRMSSPSPSRMSNTSPSRMTSSSPSRMSNTSPSRLGGPSPSSTKNISSSRPSNNSPSRISNSLSNSDKSSNPDCLLLGINVLPRNRSVSPSQRGPLSSNIPCSPNAQHSHSGRLLKRNQMALNKREAIAQDNISRSDTPVIFSSPPTITLQTEDPCKTSIRENVIMNEPLNGGIDKTRPSTGEFRDVKETTLPLVSILKNGSSLVSSSNYKSVDNGHTRKSQVLFMEDEVDDDDELDIPPPVCIQRRRGSANIQHHREWQQQNQGLHRRRASAPLVSVLSCQTEDPKKSCCYHTEDSYMDALKNAELLKGKVARRDSDELEQAVTQRALLYSALQEWDMKVEAMVSSQLPLVVNRTGSSTHPQLNTNNLSVPTDKYHSKRRGSMPLLSRQPSPERSRMTLQRGWSNPGGDFLPVPEINLERRASDPSANTLNVQVPSPEYHRSSTRSKGHGGRHTEQRSQRKSATYQLLALLTQSNNKKSTAELLEVERARQRLERPCEEQA